MLLTDEQYVIKWLSQYGPAAQGPGGAAAAAQDVLHGGADSPQLGAGPPHCPSGRRLLPGPGSLLRPGPAGDCGGVGTAAVHRPRGAPSPLSGHLSQPDFFLKENVGYEIVVLYEGERHLSRLLQPQEDLKYIIVVPNAQTASKLTLPQAPCLFATVSFQGKEEPEVQFFSGGE